MRFKATKEQMSEILVKAVNSSIGKKNVFGICMVDTKRIYTSKDIAFDMNESILINIIDGRHVKLEILRVEDMWEIPNANIINPDKEYQTWATTYPTYKNLLLRSGINTEDILQ